MSFKKSIIRPYFLHSLLILLRYQQIYAYLLLIVVLLLMPLFFNIEEQYYNILYLLNFLIVLWLFSPFYLNMFSFSSDDARSLSLFPLRFKDLVVARNFLNFSMLMIAFSLSIVLMGVFYPEANTSISELIVLAALHLLPAISIGNLTSRSSLSWTAKTTFSWKSIYVILSFYFNILVYKISQQIFSRPVFIIIILVVFLLYLVFYNLSLKKIVKEISTYFCSIAEK